MTWSPYVSMCQSGACLRDKLSPIQAAITKYGPQVLNTLVKFPIALGVTDLNLQGQIKLQNQIIPNFELTRAITQWFKLES